MFADGSPYYYETRSWFSGSTSSTPAVSTVYRGVSITEENRVTYGKMLRHAPPEAVKSMMLVKGISAEDVNSFISTSVCPVQLSPDDL